jgi:hypothetical protein
MSAAILNIEMYYRWVEAFYQTAANFYVSSSEGPFSVARGKGGKGAPKEKSLLGKPLGFIQQMARSLDPDNSRPRCYGHLPKGPSESAPLPLPGQ